MKNDNLKFILSITISVFLSSLVTAAATGNLFDSSEVVYDNTNTNLQHTDVQGAVDDLYAAATDYSDVNSRLQTVEQTVRSTSSSVIQQHSIAVGVNSTNTSAQSSVNLYQNGINRASFILGTTGDAMLSARNSSGTWQTGTLSLLGDTVNVGKSTTSGTVNLKGSNVTVNSVPIVTGKKTTYGTSLSFDMKVFAQHAIICVSGEGGDAMYFIWLAGDSNSNFIQSRRVYGTADPTGWSISNSGKTINITTSKNSTITAFIGV